MFGEMERKRIRSNAFTFINVPYTCTREGFIKEGCPRFMSMIHYYCITPQLEHYEYMVDLLSKACLLDDVQTLMVLELSDSGYYGLVNMYAEVNEWTETAKI
ncbi:Pentatricopeptide repeat-containing protein, partial [Mucuna pruriens]